MFLETLFLILISDQEPGWELPELKNLLYSHAFRAEGGTCGASVPAYVTVTLLNLHLAIKNIIPAKASRAR